MTITCFNPLIVIKDIAVYIKEGISIKNNIDVSVKDAHGFHVNVSAGDGEWTKISMNVDNLEVVITFLKVRGFRRARHETRPEMIDTITSSFNIMKSPSDLYLPFHSITKIMIK